MNIIIRVDKMDCEHCAARVQEAILDIDNVKRVKVKLDTKEVKIVYRGELDMELVKQKVQEAGYVYVG